MTPQIKMWTVVFLMLIVAGPSAMSAQEKIACPTLKTRLEKETEALTVLTQNYQELNSKFEASVQRDFTAQTEGFLDEIRRNEAVKLAFARKKLGQNLELKRQQVVQLRNQYCPKCPDDKLCPEE